MDLKEIKAHISLIENSINKTIIERKIDSIQIKSNVMLLKVHCISSSLVFDFLINIDFNELKFKLNTNQDYILFNKEEFHKEYIRCLWNVKLNEIHCFLLSKKKYTLNNLDILNADVIKCMQNFSSNV